MTIPATQFPARLRRRLAIAFVVVAGISSGALAIGADVTVHSIRTHTFLERSRRHVREDLRLLRAGVAASTIAERLAEPGGPAVVVVRSGEIASSIESVGIDEVPRAVQRDSTADPGEMKTGHTDLRGVGSALVIGISDVQSGAELYSFFPRADLQRGFDELRRTLIAGWLLVLAIAAVAGALVARRTLRPVRTAADAARRVAEGLLETRLPVRENDEFGAWASAFNEMVAALEVKIDDLADAHERERRFTADVAHELRTPIGAVLTAASHLHTVLEDIPPTERELLSIILDASRRLDRLSTELLELHRLEAGQEERLDEPVELRGAVDAIVRGHGWTDQVRVAGPRDIVVETDRRRVDRILVNLIANAVHHGGSAVAVEVGAVPPRVVVSDSGPGIAPEDLPRLFDRYFKVSSSRARTGSTASGGSGLGLAIAHESALLVGARIDVESTPGLGTRFTLSWA